MAEPVTWAILESLREEVLGILPANGYLTELGAGVVVLDRTKLKLDNEPVTLITAGDVLPSDNSQGRSILNSEMDISLRQQSRSVCSIPSWWRIKPAPI